MTRPLRYSYCNCIHYIYLYLTMSSTSLYISAVTWRATEPFSFPSNNTELLNTDVVQSLLTDQTLTPQRFKMLGGQEWQANMNGFKTVKWSPADTNTLDR